MSHGYYLTEKGWDLFPWFLTLLQWGDRWCDPTGAGPPMNLTHTACNQPLKGQVVYDQCGDEVRPDQVDFSIRNVAGYSSTGS